MDSGVDRTDFVPDALHLLGDVAIHLEGFDPEGAGAYYARALALAGERGMRPLVAHCNLGLGRLHRATGDSSRARRSLSAATATYRELGMRIWLEQGEAELRTLT